MKKEIITLERLINHPPTNVWGFLVYPEDDEVKFQVANEIGNHYLDAKLNDYANATKASVFYGHFDGENFVCDSDCTGGHPAIARGAVRHK